MHPSSPFSSLLSLCRVILLCIILLFLSSPYTYFTRLLSFTYSFFSCILIYIVAFLSFLWILSHNIFWLFFLRSSYSPPTCFYNFLSLFSLLSVPYNHLDHHLNPGLIAFIIFFLLSPYSPFLVFLSIISLLFPPLPS